MSIPEVKHSTRVKDLNRLSSVFDAFADEIAKYVRSAKGRSSIPDPVFSGEGPDLLRLRKELVARVKEGMLERKDKEIEIAVLACLVWFNRLEYEKRERILNAW